VESEEHATSRGCAEMEEGSAVECWGGGGGTHAADASRGQPQFDARKTPFVAGRT
jgi:hypothetical protein